MPDESEAVFFVDQASDRALKDLVAVREQLQAIAATLKGEDYEKATAPRMLIAAGACLDHAAAGVTAVRTTRQLRWSTRQREAKDFLELRAAGSGRTFRVVTEFHEPGRTLWQGAQIAFTIERSIALDGRPYAAVARVIATPETRTEQIGGQTFAHVGDGPSCTDVPLQFLYRAFLAGALEELGEKAGDAYATPTGPALRLEKVGNVAGGLVGRLHFAEEDERELSPDQARDAMAAAVARLGLGEVPAANGQK